MNSLASMLTEVQSLPINTMHCVHKPQFTSDSGEVFWIGRLCEDVYCGKEQQFVAVDIFEHPQGDHPDSSFLYHSIHQVITIDADALICKVTVTLRHVQIIAKSQLLLLGGHGKRLLPLGRWMGHFLAHMQKTGCCRHGVLGL
jgi:hypothetical protein